MCWFGCWRWRKLRLPGPGFRPLFDWAAGADAPSTYDEQAQNRGIATDAAGNSYVTRIFRNTLTLGSTTLTAVGDYDVYVASLDATGHYRWAVQAGGNAWSISSTVAFDASGTGVIVAQLDATGSWRWALCGGGPGNDSSAAIAQAP